MNKRIATSVICFSVVAHAQAAHVARVFFHEGIVRDRVVLYFDVPIDQALVSQPSAGTLVVRLPGCTCAQVSSSRDFDRLTRQRVDYSLSAKRTGAGLSLTASYDSARVGVFVHRMDSIGMVPALSLTFVHYRLRNERVTARHAPVIAIDCGHGGWETGASGFGLVEKDLALNIGTMLGSCLKERGYQVMYTRSSDIFVPLDRRTSLVNGHCDFLISIHHNSSTKPEVGARGIETWFLNPVQAGLIYRTANVPENLFVDNRVVKESEQAARIIHEHLLQTPGLRLVDRGIKNAFSQILLAEAPALLVELLFINNAQDAAILSSTHNLAAFAHQLCEGVERYVTTMAG